MRTFRAGLLLLLLLLLAPPFVSAQIAPTTAPAPTSKSWKFDPRLIVGTEHDNNVFLLPANKRSDPGAPSSAELLSGRYAGMESASDLITTASASLAIAGTGPGGRALTFTPSFDYEFYAQNGERSNLAMGLAIEQALRKDGRLRFRGRLQPSYFARNYLSDAVDGNVDGTITPEERVYTRGDYSESEVQVDYRHRLAKSSRSHPFGAWLTLGTGFVDRTYDGPVVARAFSGPTATARLQFDLPHGVELVTSYDLAVLGSPRTAQVILLDEPVYGEDLNGNGSATNLSARAFRTVDRSRTEHAIGESARFEVTKATDLELSVDFRWRAFSSDEPYDVANNGRRDRRMQFGAELSYRVNKAARLFGGARYGSQSLNRRTDLGAEGAVDDYTKLQVRAGLRLTR